MKDIVGVEELHVRRGRDFALEVPHFTCKRAEIICVTGPNGSGKTTLLHCLAGLLAPDRGRIAICGVPVGKNLRATKALVGFIPDDEEWLIKELCAQEYFALLARVYTDAGTTADMKARVSELAARLYFTDFARPLGSLSHGNKKKVQLIAGLMHQPPLVIIDEMRNGLDPLAIIAAEQIIREEALRGSCVIAATHDLWWAERTGSRTVLLIQGKVHSQRNTAYIKRKYGSLEQMFLRIVANQQP